MPYHLRDHVYLTQFRDDLIILDTKKDNYTICFKQISEMLIELLEEKRICLTESFGSTKNSYPLTTISTPSGSQTYSRDISTIQKLIDDNVIEEKDHIYPFHIDRKLDSNGVSNVEWRLPLENIGISLSIQVFKAFMTLLQINFYIKVRGFYSTIQLIKKTRKSQTNYIIPQDEELRDLANIVNNACLIYPTRTKCLEWAMAFVLLALKREWKCNLEIGVQNYPFFAHAWVECDGKVVMDAQDLREGLAIILNEPFRKLKI